MAPTEDTTKMITVTFKDDVVSHYNIEPNVIPEHVELANLNSWQFDKHIFAAINSGNHIDIAMRMHNYTRNIGAIIFTVDSLLKYVQQQHKEYLIKLIHCAFDSTFDLVFEAAHNEFKNYKMKPFRKQISSLLSLGGTEYLPDEIKVFTKKYADKDLNVLHRKELVKYINGLFENQEILMSV